MVQETEINQCLRNSKRNFTAEELSLSFNPRYGNSYPCIKHKSILNSGYIKNNWKILKKYSPMTQEDEDLYADPLTLSHIERYSKNIENCIGTLKIPVGVVGPLRINGFYAKSDYYVPLATTEAALVASYHRGCRLLMAAGGNRVFLIDEKISRSPGFVFKDLVEINQFVLFITHQHEKLKYIATQCSQYGRLVDIRTTLEGNHVYMHLDFTTGQAAGQNMITITTDAIVKWILEHTPIQPQHSYVEANFSGDKKASFMSFLSVRGKRVTAEISLPAKLVEKYLHTTPYAMTKYWQIAALGGVMSGTIGVQGHFANGLAAIYLATGQDVACVSESSVGITRMEVDGEGALYCAVTLPNIIVGTVGGGTVLPTQAAGLKMLGLEGKFQTQIFAEICASLCLAGELSIIGSMCANDFAAAHRKRARQNKI